MQNSNINATIVKKALPYGSIKEIAKRSKKSSMTVSRVLNKGGKNPVVLKNIKDYLEEIQKTNQQINALVADDKIAF